MQDEARSIVGFWREAGPAAWFARNADFDVNGGGISLLAALFIIQPLTDRAHRRRPDEPREHLRHRVEIRLPFDAPVFARLPLRPARHNQHHSPHQRPHRRIPMKIHVTRVPTRLKNISPQRHRKKESTLLVLLCASVSLWPAISQVCALRN